MWILSDVIDRCVDTCAILQCDDAIILQKKQCSCLVGCIVWYCDRIAVCDLIQALLCSRIDTEWLIVDLTCNCKVCALLLIEAFQIWYMLEVVGIEVSAFYHFVWLYIVIKDSHLQIIALLLKLILCILQNLSVWCCRCCNCDCLIVLAALSAACECSYQKCTCQCQCE